MANETIGFSIKVDGVERSVQSISDLQKTIADLKKEAKTLDIGSKAFEETTEKIRLAQAKFREFKNDTKAKEIKDQFNDLAGGVSSSFNVAQSSLKAFGVESKAMGTAASSANALISAALQFRNIQEMKVEASAARRMVVEKAAAAGTVILNTVNKALNTTLKANPIGVIITAVSLLAVGVVALINPIKKLISNFDFLNTAAKAVWDTLRNVASFLTGGLIDDASTAKTKSNAQKVIDSFDDINSAQNKLKKANEHQLELLEAQGASEKDLHEKRMSNMRLETAALIKLKDAYNITGDLTKYNETKSAIQDLMNQMDVEEAKYKASLNKKDTKTTTETTTKTTTKDPAIEAAENTQKEINAIREQGNKDLEVLEDEAIAIKNKAYLDSIKDEDFRAKEELRLTQESEENKLQAKIDALTNFNGPLTEEQQAIQKAQLDALYEQQKQMETNHQDEMTNLVVAQTKERGEKTAAAEREERLLGYEMQMEDETLDYETRKQASQDRETELLKNVELTENERKRIAKEGKEYREALDQEEKDKKHQIQMETLQMFANANQAMMDMSDALFSLSLRNVKKGSEEETKIKKKQFAVNKALQLSMAIITGIMSAMDAWSNGMKNPIPLLGPATAAVYMGISIAMSAAQIAKIAATKFDPGTGGGGGGGGDTPAPQPSKFARGGLVAGPGTSLSDSVPAMLSQGESVMNANSTQMFGGLLSAMNQAGGGAPIGDASSQGTPVIKAYVVSSEMTSQQEADKKVRDLARV